MYRVTLTFQGSSILLKEVADFVVVFDELSRDFGGSAKLNKALTWFKTFA
jgi:hypothetical protein